MFRHREITAKAVSAIIMLTLKWFKVSRQYPSFEVTLGVDTKSARRTRCDEVPSLGPATVGLKLPLVDLENVWSTRSLDHRCCAQRHSREQVRHNAALSRIRSCAVPTASSDIVSDCIRGALLIALKIVCSIHRVCHAKQMAAVTPVRTTKSSSLRTTLGETSSRASTS